MQVALDPAPLGVARRDDPFPGHPHLGEPVLGLDVQLLVLQRDGRRPADRLDQLWVVRS